MRPFSQQLLQWPTTLDELKNAVVVVFSLSTVSEIRPWLQFLCAVVKRSGGQCASARVACVVRKTEMHIVLDISIRFRKKGMHSTHSE